ncbi:MAG: insulinase family protein [Candidatus Poribacteria bacterium]|nr:insulinase family protein [Candidatus Poribacteria bacterium]
MHQRRHFLFQLSIIVAIVSLIASTSWAGYKRINEPNPAGPMAVQIYQLDNGFTVYLTENHEEPRLYAEIAVRAGSKHDPAETTGMAHYLEHMLSKGTKNMGTIDYEKEKPHLDRIVELYEQHFHETDPAKRKEIYAEINKESQLAAQYSIPRELDKLYKALGGVGRNAHTWHEETVYKVDLPANRLKQWAIIESDRFIDPVFRLFQTELETVYEEKNRSMDNKSRIIGEAVRKLLYKNHPYGQQTTLGSVEHLKNPSLKKMYEFYHTYYVPNNMAVHISGDIDSEETIRIIDEYFSRWEAEELPGAKTWEEEPLQGAERVTVKYQGEEYVRLAFRTAGRNHQDAEALKLIDMILHNATAGLINLNLNQGQKVRRAGSYPYLGNDYGTQYLWGIPKEGQSLEEVEALLLEQIELIKKGEFEEWIIPAVVTDFKKSQKADLESNRARVSIMRDSFLAYQDWDDTVSEISRMEKLTKQGLVAAANRYFGDNYVAGYRVDEQHEVPSIEKPALDTIEIDATRQSDFAKGVLAMSVEEIEPVFVDSDKDYKTTDYHDGVKLYYAQNPINDLFAFTMSIEIGSRHDNKLPIAAQLLDKSGAAKYSAEALKKEWYKLGTDFSINVRNNETTISISGLDENFSASLALLVDYLKHPTADAATLEELIKIILVNREDAKKNYRTIRSALVNYNRHGVDSRFLRLAPSGAVQKLTVDELHEVIQGLLNYQHTISYTGSLSLDKVLATLKKYHPISGDLQTPPPYHFLKARIPEETEVFFFHKELAQSQVNIEFGDEDYNEANNPAIQLYNAYFAGGMSGIVFQELREARALAYSTSARYATGSRKGKQNLMRGYIACQTDKTAEAVEAFIDLIDNLPESPERFDEARQSRINRYRTAKIGFRDVIGAVRSWERLEVPIDPRKWRYEQIQKSDMDLMLQFHKGHVHGRPKLISIVGDRNKMDMERLAKVGQVIEIGLKDIFVD